MSQDTATIKSFTDLNAWREAHRLVVEIYKATKLFPAEETFGLTSQIRRAAVSITSNIAEGFSRATDADKTHFYTMAHGSLTELQNQLLIARDVGYLQPAGFTAFANQTVRSHKLLSGLIKATKQRSKKS
jgi:four helix bundle protein